MVANALSRGRPPREQDQESNQHKMQAANAVEVEATQAQDQDQSFFNFIQASKIEVSTTQMQQFREAQSTDKDILHLLAQSGKELKRQHLQQSPQGILYRM